MSEHPRSKDHGDIGLALLDELVRTLVAKGIISEADVRDMLEAAAGRVQEMAAADPRADAQSRH